MKEFKARFIVESQVAVYDETVAGAEKRLRKHFDSAGIDGKILGIIPADQAWPDEEEVTKRPPRNTPPGGSPGTPTLDAQPELVQAVAA